MTITDDKDEKWWVREKMVNVVGLGNPPDEPGVCLSILLGETQVNFASFDSIENARKVAAKIAEEAGL